MVDELFVTRTFTGPSLHPPDPHPLSPALRGEAMGVMGEGPTTLVRRLRFVLLFVLLVIPPRLLADTPPADPKLAERIGHPLHKGGDDMEFSDLAGKSGISDRFCLG